MQDLRSKQAKTHEPAQFSEDILHERLVWSVPLQKLYERIYFDDYDLAKDCLKFDKLPDFTISAEYFTMVIKNAVPNMTKEDLRDLILDVPRLDIKKIDDYQKKFSSFNRRKIDEPNEIRVLYKRLYEVMRKFADNCYPIASLYTRYDPDPISKNQDALASDLTMLTT